MPYVSRPMKLVTVWLTEEEKATLDRLAREEDVTLSKAIRKLEGAGLVTRQGAPHDARATQVGFNTRGRRIVAKAIVAVEDAEETFFAGLDGDQLRSWMSLTSEVIGLQATTESAESS